MTDSRAAAPESALIAVVRHGETDWNLAGRIQGHTEVPLNDTGRGQAAATATALARASAYFGQWRGVRSSPLGRAWETAEILAGGLALPAPLRDESLWERSFGSAEGLDVQTAHARWPGLEIPDAEPLAALAERSSRALARVLREAPGTVVVAHGAMIRTGLAHLTGAEIPRIANGEVWLVRASAGGHVTERLTDHLAERLADPAPSLAVDATQLSVPDPAR